MHPQGITLTQTGNGWLVQIPTRFKGPMNFGGLDMEQFGEVVAAAQGAAPDPLLENLQREQKQRQKAETFDEIACLLPGAFHFSNIEKAILFVHLIVREGDIEKALKQCDPTFHK